MIDIVKYEITSISYKTTYTFQVIDNLYIDMIKW